MRRIFGSVLIIFGSLLLVPVSAGADSLSVSQIITITANVAPARMIILNPAGRMVDIYTNTAESVIPTVRVTSPTGPIVPLTAALTKQYTQVIRQTKDLVGVEIPVDPKPVIQTQPLQTSTLQGSISSLLRPVSLTHL